MGTDIDQEEFDERDYSRFAERLEECLSALGQLLERPGFGAGPATVGAELEVFLVDGAARPLPHNQAIRAAVADPRVTVELDRFNLELNASPVPLAGRPFATLGGELNVLLDHVADAAQDHAGRLALIGILPTLSQADLGPGRHDRCAAVPGAEQRPAAAAPGPVPHPDRGRGPARAGQRGCRAGRGEQLVPGAPSRRPGRLHAHLQRGPARHGTRAGRVRQLAHFLGPPALGRDPDRCVQAVG